MRPTVGGDLAASMNVLSQPHGADGRKCCAQPVMILAASTLVCPTLVARLGHNHVAHITVANEGPSTCVVSCGRCADVELMLHPDHIGSVLHHARPQIDVLLHFLHNYVCMQAAGVWAGCLTTCAALQQPAECAALLVSLPWCNLHLLAYVSKIGKRVRVLRERVCTRFPLLDRV